MTWLTTADVVRATGVSRFTLIRYHKAGLIPPPVKGRHPGGSGMTGRWPNSIVARVKAVREAMNAPR